MPETRGSRRSIAVNLSLLAAAAVLFVACMVIGGRSTSDGAAEESFVGTDTTAVTAIEDSHPHYEPWFQPIFAPPSAEVESGLFALQAALGAGVFGYALGALRRRRTTSGPAPAVGDDHR
jgi:cobalt/nickel transport protein